MRGSRFTDEQIIGVNVWLLDDCPEGLLCFHPYPRAHLVSQGGDSYLSPYAVESEELSKTLQKGLKKQIS